jgi:hypothetical protein
MPEAMRDAQGKRVVERVQTGVRIEKRILKVTKGLAEVLDVSLGDLLEGILLHNFEGKTPFAPRTLHQIETLRALHGLDLTSADAHVLKEKQPPRRRTTK